LGLFSCDADLFVAGGVRTPGSLAAFDPREAALLAVRARNLVTDQPIVFVFQLAPLAIDGNDDHRLYRTAIHRRIIRAELGEQVGSRRWNAVLLGMIGALVVMRPGMGLLHWSSLVALLGAFFFALFNLVTRKLAATDGSWTTLFYTFAIGTVLSSASMSVFWVTLDFNEWLLFGACGVLGLAAHFCLFRALTLADVSVLAPLTYVRLLWAVAIGWLLFRDIPDAMTLIGGCITIASGLYVVTFSAQTVAGSSLENERSSH
jgi:uncharacterized membrane protein